MIEADGSPGSGQSPAPSAPANPQANGGEQPPATATLSSEMQSAITKAVRDAINADARRATAPVKSKPTTSTTEAPAPTVDLMRLRELDRAVTRAGFAERLDGAAHKRLERAFVEESPDDAEAWVGGYFGGLGLAKTTSTPSTNTNAAPAAATATPTGQPVSDRGAPPAPKVPLEEMDLLRMGESDRAAFIKAKGSKAYLQALTTQLKGRPVKFR